MNSVVTGVLKSKTMWVNGLLLIGMLLDQVAAGGAIGGIVLGPVGIAVVAGVNMVLRAFTNKALSEK